MDEEPVTSPRKGPASETTAPVPEPAVTESGHQEVIHHGGARGLLGASGSPRESHFFQVNHMAEITAQLVKQLRERTGAGMMECKSALTEAKGDLAEAEVVLRKRGIASAGKKASRTTKQGLIGTYIHARRAARRAGGSRTANPISWRAPTISRNWCTIWPCTLPPPTRNSSANRMSRPRRSKKRGKSSAPARSPRRSPRRSLDKIIEGRMAKFYEEVCLYEQPFVKENTLTIDQLIKTKIAKLGENIVVSRFARFKVGDAPASSGGEGEAAVSEPVEA